MDKSVKSDIKLTIILTLIGTAGLAGTVAYVCWNPDPGFWGYILGVILVLVGAFCLLFAIGGLVVMFKNINKEDAPNGAKKGATIALISAMLIVCLAAGILALNWNSMTKDLEYDPDGEMFSTPVNSSSNNKDYRCAWCEGNGASYKHGSYYYHRNCYSELMGAAEEFKNIYE